MAAVAVGVFGAGIALGALAARRGVPRDQIPRWLALGVTRVAVRAVDRLRGRRFP